MNKKTVLITGGNSGIGFACAKKFMAENFTVYICGRNEEKLKAASNELGCRYFVSDFTKGNPDIDLAALGGHLDLLVNNAGIAKIAAINDLDDVMIDESFKVNVYAPMLLSKIALPLLKKAKGMIINISSAITYRGAANFSLYAATKGAIEAWTRNMAVELAQDGVRVNAVCPGAIETPMSEKISSADQNRSELRDYILSTIPMSRLGMAEEVANVVYNLGVSTYATGAIWRVDGGVGA